MPAFSRAEYDERMARLQDAMAEAKLDAILLFAQESMYWLTGFDTFGYAYFQCLVVTRSGRMALLARPTDVRQARQTSIIEEILVWSDRADADPARSLKDMLFEFDLLGARLGVEYDTVGLTARDGQRLDEQLRSFGTLVDASDIVPVLRSVKSPAEIEATREAARLADAAWRVGTAAIAPGVQEHAIRAVMQDAVLSGGGDYAASEFHVGSGERALLMRPASGTRTLSENDQITFLFAAAAKRYHAAMLDTVILGVPKPAHEAMFDAVSAALDATLEVMRPGHTLGEAYDAHARALQEHGMGLFRLSSCGVSLGAAFAPAWMDDPMICHGNADPVVPNMVLLAHAVLLDPEQEAAMALGRSYLTTDGEPEPLSAIAPCFVRV